MGFDIGQFEWKKNAEQGVDFVIKSPKDGTPLEDAEGKPLTINAHGAESSRIRSAVRERIKQRQAEIQPDAPSPEYTVEQREADIVDDLVMLTNGWSDNWALDGAPFKYSPDNARLLYTRFPDIAEQMVANVSHRVNFMSGLPKK